MAELEKGANSPDVEKSGIFVEHLTKTTSGDSLSPQQTHAPEDEKLNFTRFMALAAMAFLWTGSQIPLYLYGAVPPYIYGELGGADRWIWFVLGYLLALAAICPFVGSLSDLFGRKWTAVGGATLLIIGNIVTSTAHTMNIFIAGMSLAGVGAGILELTALAVTSEIAPTSKRGIYNAWMVFTIVPYCPSQLWGQLVAYHGSWRYIGLWCGVWAFIGLVLTLIFYSPPPRENSAGMTKMEVLKRVDFVGGFLSISGLLMFMAGIQWGGYNYPWTSVHVLVPLFLGVFLVAGFLLWEAKFAKFPMFPARLRQEPRILILTLIITFISGANFFSVILFWPTQSYNVYGHNPVDVGIRNIPLGFSILTGACVVLFLLSYTKGNIRWLMFTSCVFMTAGGGAMAALRIDNIWLVYVVLVIGGLGIGGIVVPASIITNIICPDELIATVTALTLAIRVLGGAIGYCIYYNIFAEKFKYAALNLYLLPVSGKLLNTTDAATLTAIVDYTAAGLLPMIKTLIPEGSPPGTYESIVEAGQMTYAYAYPYVYYVSIAFGSISIICSFFLGDIKKYMKDHIAVHM